MYAKSFDSRKEGDCFFLLIFKNVFIFSIYPFTGLYLSHLMVFFRNIPGVIADPLIIGEDF